MSVVAGTGIVAGRDTVSRKGRGAGAVVRVAGAAQVSEAGVGQRAGWDPRPVWGTGTIGARMAFAEAAESNERLGAGAVVANRCSRTSGCSGARATEVRWLIQWVSARPLNLFVGQLPTIASRRVE